jgi:hypothetical protein
MTIGGGSAWAGGGGGGGQISQMCPQATRKVQNGKKRAVTNTYWLKNNQKYCFYIKVINKIYPRDIFEEYMTFKIFEVLKAMLSYSCSKFKKSYMLPATRIRVNIEQQEGNKIEDVKIK